jgi:hypothetical protein
MVILIQHGTEPDKSAGIQDVSELTPGYCKSFIKLFNRTIGNIYMYQYSVTQHGLKYS